MISKKADRSKTRELMFLNTAKPKVFVRIGLIVGIFLLKEGKIVELRKSHPLTGWFTPVAVTQEGKYVCEECGQKFRLKSWLRNHLRSKHVG